MNPRKNCPKLTSVCSSECCQFDSVEVQSISGGTIVLLLATFPILVCLLAPYPLVDLWCDEHGGRVKQRLAIFCALLFLEACIDKF